MKITRKQLRQIIKEEIAYINENPVDSPQNAPQPMQNIAENIATFVADRLNLQNGDPDYAKIYDGVLDGLRQVEIKNAHKVWPCS